MKGTRIFIKIILIIFASCNKSETAIDILSKTINTIDTIETISYKQEMSRTIPRNLNDTIQGYRMMNFKRLISDSIVGVMGHWYMYVEDKVNVIYEDIYDGDRLLRKNNRDSIVRFYDLIKYPDFKVKSFWGHKTLFGMQHEFRYILKNLDSYSIDRLKDTIVNDKKCFQIQVILEDKMTMPGFSIKLEDKKGNVSKILYCIDMQTYYPIKMRGENYTTDNPKQKLFIDQRYYDIKFNLVMNENIEFNTFQESIGGFEIREMKPE